MEGFKVPDYFTVNKSLGAGDYRLFEIFPRIDKLAIFWELARTKKDLDYLINTSIKLIDKDIYMYVAPKRPLKRVSWKPIIVDTDCIVIGIAHLKYSPEPIVYLDIFHELFHILQRNHGRHLWSDISYVENPCEIEAYRFVVNEAKMRGATNKYLRDYLKIEWISKKDMKRLFAAVGV